jgi:hypothetical protein
MAKLAIILGEFTQNSQHPSTMELHDYEGYLQALEEWSSSLPPSLRAFVEDIDNAQQSTLPQDDEFSSVSQQE